MIYYCRICHAPYDDVTRAHYCNQSAAYWRRAFDRVSRRPDCRSPRPSYGDLLDCGFRMVDPDIE